MFFVDFFNENILNTKINRFVKVLKNYHKTKDFNLIINFKLYTNWNAFVDTFFFIILAFIGVGSLFAVGVIIMIAVTEQIMASIATVLVGGLAFGASMYTARKNRKDLIKNRFDEAVFIIIKYLVEIYRDNYKFKFYKEDLSYLFINIPTKLLIILNSIQDNVRVMQESEEKLKNSYKKIIKIEIRFYIVILRDFYNLSEDNINYDFMHSQIVGNMIELSNNLKTIKNDLGNNDKETDANKVSNSLKSKNKTKNISNYKNDKKVK